MGIRCRPRCYPGRRRGRALGRRAPAAGPGRVGRALPASGWWRGALAPKRRPAAEVVENTRQHRDQLRELGTRLPPEAPATAGTQTHRARQLSRYHRVRPCFLVTDGLRRAVGPAPPAAADGAAIASETPNTAFYVLRAARAAQRRRPRIAAGRALVAAGSVARLRAASAEPLR